MLRNVVHQSGEDDLGDVLECRVKVQQQKSLASASFMFSHGITGRLLGTATHTRLIDHGSSELLSRLDYLYKFPVRLLLENPLRWRGRARRL